MNVSIYLRPLPLRQWYVVVLDHADVLLSKSDGLEARVMGWSNGQEWKVGG